MFGIMIDLKEILLFCVFKGKGIQANFSCLLQIFDLFQFIDKINASSCNSESFQFSIDKKAIESWNDWEFLRCLIGTVSLHYAHLSGFRTVRSTSVKPNTNECSTINHILEKRQVFSNKYRETKIRLRWMRWYLYRNKTKLMVLEILSWFV